MIMGCVGLSVDYHIFERLSNLSNEVRVVLYHGVFEVVDLDRFYYLPFELVRREDLVT